MSAKRLLRPMAPPLRTACWLTGVSFVVVSLLFLVRALVIFFSGGQPYGIYVQMPVNPATFFIVSLAQLCLTFGFVLMLNYRLANDLNDLAMHDALTGAFNRRSLETELVRMLARCSRTGDVIAVIMMDVDHFKTVNDRHGHAAGDEVLRRLSAVAQDSIRTEDFFARYGGEEFCIVLPSTTAEKARDLAERLRRNYAEMTVRYADQAIQSTVSIGIADSRQSGVSMDCLLNYADQALYRAKREGRNRSLIFEG